MNNPSGKSAVQLPRLAVGIDLVQISQVASSLDRLGDAYMTRIFTSDEIAYCSTSPAMAPSRFAARFAAKEATLKALRLEDQGVDMRSIEVRQMPGGWSEIALSGRAQELASTAGWSSWSVSLSHEGDYATAVVTAIIAPTHNP
jgi:holo-[acyl-carrier protein] synthase